MADGRLKKPDYSGDFVPDPALGAQVPQVLIDPGETPLVPNSGLGTSLAQFQLNLLSVLVNYQEAMSSIDGSDPTSQQTLLTELANNLGSQIKDYIQTAIVNSGGNVIVTSVSGVTTGPGISGPGAGTSTSVSTGIS